MRDGAVGQLVGLITRRSQVRILLSLPNSVKGMYIHKQHKDIPEKYMLGAIIVYALLLITFLFY